MLKVRSLFVSVVVLFLVSLGLIILNVMLMVKGQ